MLRAMPLSEADTRAKLIDPAIRARGWPEELIAREETAGAVALWGEGAHRTRGRIDYVLRAPAAAGPPLPVALIEAKPESQPPLAGLEQAKRYGRLHHVPFVYAANGHAFAEHCLDSGETRGPLPMEEFPAPAELLARYEALRGLDLAAPDAAPLLEPSDGEDYYYQRAAVRAVLERLARGERRALLSLATGSGKTRIAVRLLRALADSGRLRRALFVCDRDELRSQALTALHGAFGDDAASATARDPAHNARVVVATYQTLGVGEDGEGGGDGSYLERHYPRDWFSHVVIDECHRSAWGRWSAVLTRNAGAVHVGLTATPRRITPRPGAGDADSDGDDAITRNNYEYFGEPAYDYGIAQGMDDGYLAAMRLERSDVLTAGLPEREHGVESERLEGGDVRDAITGQPATVAEMRGRYAAGSLEQDLMIAERTEEMCDDLFARLAASEDGPEQKTLVFCASDDHADRVAAALNNRYAAWARGRGAQPAEPYAFKCTAAAGSDLLATLKANQRRAFAACTVDLISTGVDVPCLRHVVFFRYLKSPIAFHQMLGRGTRIHEPTGKLAFTVHDYTNATRLLDAPLAQRAEADREPPEDPGEQRELRRFEVSGIAVRVLHGGTDLAVQEGGCLRFVSLAGYRERLAERLLAEVPALGGFRERWIDPPAREALLAALPDEGRSAEAYRAAAGLEECDLYDVLASAGWDETPRPRVDRAGRVGEADPAPPAIERALARQFALGGTEALESERLAQVSAVREAGGLAALAAAGGGAMPALKRRLLATDAEWTPR